MPTSTAHGFVKPASYSEVPDGPGAIGALADSVETFATNEVDPLWAVRSDQKILSATASPTSTTNVTMPSLDMSVTVLGTTDVVWVELDAEVIISATGTINLVELLVDGVADPKALRTQLTASLGTVSGHKAWRLTGLTAGAHTLAFRTRNTAGSTNASVSATNTSVSYSVDIH